MFSHTKHEEKISPRLSHKSMYNRYNFRIITFLVMGPYRNHLSPRDGYFSETSNVLCRHYGTERSHDSIICFLCSAAIIQTRKTIKGLSSLDYTPNQEILAVPHGTQTIPRLDRVITTVPRMAEHSWSLDWIERSQLFRHRNRDLSIRLVFPVIVSVETLQVHTLAICR